MRKSLIYTTCVLTMIKETIFMQWLSAIVSMTLQKSNLSQIVSKSMFRATRKSLEGDLKLIKAPARTRIKIKLRLTKAITKTTQGILSQNLTTITLTGEKLKMLLQMRKTNLAWILLTPSEEDLQRCTR